MKKISTKLKSIKQPLFLFFILYSFSSNAQFVSGIGATGGITYAREKWSYTNPLRIEKKNFLLGFNGSLFVEFFQHDYLRWVSELQYNQKGTIEQLNSGDVKDRLQYLSFNNFLKARYELLDVIPYVLIGPRVEYLLSASPQTDFNKIHVGVSVGAGAELVAYSNFKFFAEMHYNSDILNAYNKNSLSIKNTAFELRIGLKYAIKKRRESCPPVYTFNYYK